jgi:hypothetical protein
MRTVNAGARVAALPLPVHLRPTQIPVECVSRRAMTTSRSSLPTYAYPLNRASGCPPHCTMPPEAPPRTMPRRAPDDDRTVEVARLAPHPTSPALSSDQHLPGGRQLPYSPSEATGGADAPAVEFQEQPHNGKCHRTGRRTDFSPRRARSVPEVTTSPVFLGYRTSVVRQGSPAVWRPRQGSDKCAQSEGAPED